MIKNHPMKKHLLMAFAIGFGVPFLLVVFSGVAEVLTDGRVSWSDAFPGSVLFGVLAGLPIGLFVLGVVWCILRMKKG